MTEQLGPYRILRRLATGGMAEVYLARQQGIEGVDRTVVVKRVHPQYGSDEEFITMFLDEARLMATLSHPNIAQVFDLGRVGDSFYLVMEHVRGPSLEAVLEAQRARGEKHLPVEVSLPILMQVAEALRYVHEMRDEYGRPLQVVHRDLNPANVLIGYNGAVKLIDFGIAKTAIRVYETRQGVVKGTYGYIAPEQLGGSGTVDHRADLFSLGVLMYEVCTGELPFGPGEAPNLLERLLKGQYRKPSRVSPNFPEALEPLLARCLAPNPADRLPSLRAFIDELSNYMASRRILPTLARLSEDIQRMVPDPDGPEPLIVKRVESKSGPHRPPADTDNDVFTDTAIAKLPPTPREPDFEEDTHTVRTAPLQKSVPPPGHAPARERPGTPTAVGLRPAGVDGPRLDGATAPRNGGGRSMIFGFIAGLVFFAILFFLWSLTRGS